jgi:hypothetical protein
LDLQLRGVGKMAGRRLKMVRPQKHAFMPMNRMPTHKASRRQVIRLVLPNQGAVCSGQHAIPIEHGHYQLPNP